MASPKDNVIPFARPAPAVAISTARERWALANTFHKCAEQSSRPVAVVYKALSFMLGENAMPDDLRVDARESRHDSVILLANFTVHPGAVRTIVRVSRPYDSAVIDNTLGVQAIEQAFLQLAPWTTMYQVFALKPSRSLLGGLLAFGAWLEHIEHQQDRRLFHLGVPTLEGWARIVVTLHVPYE